MADRQQLTVPHGTRHDASSAPTRAGNSSSEDVRSTQASSMSISTLETHKGLEAGHAAHEDDEWSAEPAPARASQDVEKGPPPPTSAPSAKDPSARDPNIVEWDGPDDPENPQNWSVSKRWILTTSLSGTTFCVTFASTIFSTATQVTAIEFNTSNEVMILGTSLFVLGFFFGPMIWGPLSEIYGRKTPMFTGVALLAIFQIPVAVAQNIETILVMRFLQGIVGCSPLAIVGGALADIWGPVDRGIAIITFAGATFIGPVAGPIIGGFITASYLTWRWTAWITLIMIAFFGSVAFVLVPETYAPVLLSRRAKNLRFSTQNWALHAKHDEARIDINSILTRYLIRPLRMLFTEPILFLLTIYMALIYGILYLFFEAYPITFQGQRGWSPGVAALPFLALIIGVIIGGGLVVWSTKTRFAQKMAEHGRVIPEERLPPMIVGAFLLPIGLFWFAWTSSPDIHWAPQVIAGVPIGAGVLMIFIQGLSYIIDVYLMYANSAIAGNTIVRSLLGAAFPLFANYMFANLGVAWATSTLAFLTLAMVPVPIAFYFYGHVIRKWSRLSPTAKR